VKAARQASGFKTKNIDETLRLVMTASESSGGITKFRQHRSSSKALMEAGKYAIADRPVLAS
jgi:hypothetical protein